MAQVASPSLSPAVEASRPRQALVGAADEGKRAPRRMAILEQADMLLRALFLRWTWVPRNAGILVRYETRICQSWTYLRRRSMRLIPMPSLKRGCSPPHAKARATAMTARLDATSPFRWVARCWCRSVTGAPWASWCRSANTGSPAGRSGRRASTRASSRPSSAPSASRISMKRAPPAPNGFPNAISRRCLRACACSRRRAACRAWCTGATAVGASSSPQSARWTIAGWSPGPAFSEFTPRAERRQAGRRSWKRCVRGQLRVSELTARAGLGFLDA